MNALWRVITTLALIGVSASPNRQISVRVLRAPYSVDELGPARYERYSDEGLVWPPTYATAGVTAEAATHSVIQTHTHIYVFIIYQLLDNFFIITPPQNVRTPKTSILALFVQELSHGGSQKQPCQVYRAAKDVSDANIRKSR